MTEPIKKISSTLFRRFCTAPMLDWTDRHCRFMFRQLSENALIYTEMITTGALIHGDHERLLRFQPEEKPLALQLGGSDPGSLASCARLVKQAGYDEINLNVGCPSDKVQNGRFGACLMKNPELVAECVSAMHTESGLPVTVKTRIGIDYQDDKSFLDKFIATVAEAGCRTFIIHARKAWLNGLSPKENRSIPPLQYDRVKQLKQDFPELEIIINGGITTLTQAEDLLPAVDGVMIGRAAYHNAYMLAEVDRRFYHNSRPIPSRLEIMLAMLPYIADELACGTRLNALLKPLLSLYHGQPGGRLFRRYLSEQGCRKNVGIEVLVNAIRHVEPDTFQQTEGF